MIIQQIGCGNMGSAVLKSIINHIKQQDSQTYEIYIHETYPGFSTEQFDYPVKLGINTQADILIIAIKPQDLDQIPLADYQSDALLVSMLAGTSVATLKKQQWQGPIMRIMPNLLMNVDAGTTGYFVDGNIDPKHLALLQHSFETTGKFISVKHEQDINYITALTGSGPAYIYYIAQAMIEQAQHRGFSQQDANDMILNLFTGASSMMLQSDESPDQLRARVTSKGGTTQAALQSFADNQLAHIIQQGIQAANNRAQELAS